MKINNKIG